MLTLPWPPSTLSPNGRLHWARLAKAKAEYRKLCKAVTARSGRWKMPETFDIALRFVPPTRRNYDRDNLLARMKAGLDGMCDAMGIDDKRIGAITVHRLAESEGRPGRVELTFRTDPETCVCRSGASGHTS